MISEQMQKMFGDKFDCTFCDIVSGKITEHPELILHYNAATSFKSRILEFESIREAVDFVCSFQKRTIAPFKGLASNCDLVIFAGGNSLMELNKVFPGNSRIMYKRVKEIRKQNIPVAFCFSGVGPFECRAGKRYVNKTLQLADFISVRDNKSKALCESLGIKDLNVWRDPVLAYEPKLSECEPEKIAVNIYFGTNKSLEVKTLKSYVKLIDGLEKRFPGLKISLFASETADYKQVMSVYEKFENDDRVEALNIASPDELFSLYEKSALVIGARMHSLITAIISGKPIAAISWQQKVDSFVNFIGCGQFSISQEDFCNEPEKLVSLAKKSVDNYSYAEPQIVFSLENVRLDLDNSLKSFALNMEDKYGL